MNLISIRWIFVYESSLMYSSSISVVLAEWFLWHLVLLLLLERSSFSWCGWKTLLKHLIFSNSTTLLLNVLYSVQSSQIPGLKTPMSRFFLANQKHATCPVWSDSWMNHFYDPVHFSKSSWIVLNETCMLLEWTTNALEKWFKACSLSSVVYFLNI